uniref:Aminopeptidase n=1 Tax=Ditylenchus dipsaci TaxID=166011 RepID=A0A915CSA1_9BILA
MSSSMHSTCSSHKRFASTSLAHQRASLLVGDELEPCLTTSRKVNGNSSPLGFPRPPPAVIVHNNGSLRPKKERLSTSLDTAALRQKKQSDCVGKCVLCLFINAIFVFGVFLAFLIGHWASSSLTDSLFGNGNKTTNSSLTNPSTLAPANSVDGIKVPPPSRYNLMSNNFKKGTNQNSSSTDSHSNYDFKNINNNSSINTDQLLELIAKQRQQHKMKVPSIFDIYLQLNSYKSSKADGSAVASTNKQPLVPLPRNVMPSHYDLQLDFTEFSSQEHIRGNASITLESFGNSTDDELVFHAASNIFIHRIRLKEAGEVISVKSVKRHFQRDLVRVILNERLKATWYTLEVEFRTKICQSELEGGVHCIKTTFLDKDNSSLITKIVGFTTKFEPCFARTFLPSWDEPRVKTTFNIVVKHPSNKGLELGALTPWPCLATPNQMGLQLRVYLLAFAIGMPLRPLELRTNRNLPLTIWVEADKVLAIHFAANFSPVMFDRVEEEFGVKYPLAKMDFVVVPNFPVGGMENWGLIVFHSNTILLSMSSTEDDQQNMAVDRISEQYKIQKVITHEVVHQWFGNLVTMNEWENLWMSEGFATYFVFDFLNEEHPHLTEYEYYMRLIELFNKQPGDAEQKGICILKLELKRKVVHSGIQGIQRMESKTSTSPIALVHPLNTAQQINDMFDGVHLYTKGAVIVKMIKDLVGAFDFRAGITRYLKKYSFKSVDRSSLWSCLPTRADHGAEQEKLDDVLQSWLVNEGLPEVIVSRNYDDQSIRVTQRPSNQNIYAIYLTKRKGDDKRKHQQRKRASVQLNGKESVEYQLKSYITWDNFTDSTSKEQESESQNHEMLSSQADLFYLNSTTLLPSHTFLTTVSSTFNDSYFHTSHSPQLQHKQGKENSEHQKHPRTHQRGAAYRNHLQGQEMATYDSDRIPLFSRHVGQKTVSAQPKDTSSQIWLDNPEDSSKSRQSRAQPNGKKGPPLWWIPFSYAFGSARSPKGQTIRQFWLKNETVRFVDVGLAADQYFLANPHWVYPYKINYDMDNWKMLIKQMHSNHLEIPMMSRIQLLVDAETYLKQSGVPHHYIHLLSYLSKETELSVLLTGLDAIHNLVDLFSGTSVVGAMLVNFVPVIQQMDRMMEATLGDPQLAALWLLSPLRLAKLYQLRCLANLGTCAQNQQVSRWLAFPTALDAEHHQQITAICHFLFTQAGPLLKQKSTTWSVTIQLATCVRDETLIKIAVQQIIKTMNAAIYSSVLKSSYSLQYNRKFREIFWRGIANLSINERQLLFAVNSGQSDRIARIFIHSVRTMDELNQVENLLIQWPEHLRIHFKYVRRKFNWVQEKAKEQIRRFLTKDI